MKNVMLFFLAVVILPSVGYTQQPDVNAILENSETKDKVFSTIMEDHELMTEFMGKMMSNEHAMMMMKGNKEMMDRMMGERMMKMMKDNPEMMHGMMGEMMKDGDMMGQMMKKMKQEGMMSDECMQSCMQMMKDKGMPMNMGMTESDAGGGGHESHH